MVLIPPHHMLVVEVTYEELREHFKPKPLVVEELRHQVQPGVALLALSTHLQCMSLSLTCWISSVFLRLLIKTPFLVIVCSSTALLPAPSSCRMKRERGSSVSQLCTSCSVLWDVELKPWSVMWFLLSYMEAGRDGFEAVPDPLLSLLSSFPYQSSQ